MIKADLLTRLCRARRRLEGELDVPAAVSTLAREAGLTTGHFITQFRSVFGQTPLQYRVKARLDLASRLLVTTDDAITDICLDLGFENAGSFSRAFKRQFGCAPRTYRSRRAPPFMSPAGCVALMNLVLAGSVISAKSPAPSAAIIKT